METLQTNISPDDPQFKKNAAYHRQLAKELHERLNTANQGGGTKYRIRHEEQGKLFVYDRIDRLLDPGSPFLELSALAAYGMYGGKAHGAGIVTGIGRVSEGRKGAQGSIAEKICTSPSCQATIFLPLQRQ